MEEIWKDIAGYEGHYQISNIGNVRSLDRVINHSGSGFSNVKGRLRSINKYLDYNYVGLTKDTFYKNMRVHRLVAFAFIPNPNGFKEVNHIDGNKRNNCVSNLEWISRSGNLKHALATGLKEARKGESNFFSRLKERDVLKIREMYDFGFSRSEISYYMNVSESTTYNITTRSTWKHI